jgi:HSP20 family protein
MVNLTSYDPFEDNFERLFRNFMHPLRAVRQLPEIKIEVREADKNYVVCAEIPGVKKEDINVTIDGNRVTISTEMKQDKEEKKDGKLLHSERYYGKVYRAFDLDQDVDETASQAEFKDGVLQLTLAKKAAPSQKKLTVK